MKNLGACWDADKKKWFVPPGVTLRPFLKWNPVVNGWPISTWTRTFVGGAVDLASVKAQLRRLQFRDDILEITYTMRSTKVTSAAGNEVVDHYKRKAQDDGVVSSATAKRPCYSSPEKDNKKLSATVTPQKSS